MGLKRSGNEKVQTMFYMASRHEKELQYSETLELTSVYSTLDQYLFAMPRATLSMFGFCVVVFSSFFLPFFCARWLTLGKQHFFCEKLH